MHDEILPNNRYDDIRLISKFGRIEDVDTIETPTDVWNGGGIYTGQPTGSPETVELFSSDANDTALGTGMRTVRITGLTSSDATSETSEDLTLNGITTVVSTNTWYRIYRAEGLTYGSNEANVGSITVRHTTTTANVFASVPVGQGQTTIAAVTIPAGYTGYLKSLYVIFSRASGAAASGQISLRCREFGSGGYRAVRYYGVTTSVAVSPPPPLYGTVFPARSDIKLQVESVSDNDCEVSADFDILIVRN